MDGVMGPSGRLIRDHRFEADEVQSLPFEPVDDGANETPLHAVWFDHDVRGFHDERLHVSCSRIHGVRGLT